MSVVAGTRRICPVCKASKLIKYEILSKNSPCCIKCRKEGKAPMPKPRPPQPAIRASDYLICESLRSDSCWHIRRHAGQTTACGKIPKDVSSVAQGASALLTLRDDPGVCIKCKSTLKRMFEEAGAN